jgi:hypothetical protein
MAAVLAATSPGYSLQLDAGSVTIVDANVDSMLGAGLRHRHGAVVAAAARLAGAAVAGQEAIVDQARLDALLPLLLRVCTFGLEAPVPVSKELARRRRHAGSGGFGGGDAAASSGDDTADARLAALAAVEAVLVRSDGPLLVDRVTRVSPVVLGLLFREAALLHAAADAATVASGGRPHEEAAGGGLSPVPHENSRAGGGAASGSGHPHPPPRRASSVHLRRAEAVVAAIGVKMSPSNADAVLAPLLLELDARGWAPRPVCVRVIQLLDGSVPALAAAAPLSP